jgi:hypothetical protein
MLIYGIHASISEKCGISIFNKHLKQTLCKKGINFETVNIKTSLDYLKNGEWAILHYAPSLYSSEQSSKNLIKLLNEIDFEKLIVIFHNVYMENEKRFLKDAACPNQEIHLELILKKSYYLIALSETVQANLMSWFSKFNISNNIQRLEHPGLFISKSSLKIDIPYLFLGGISRPKKNYTNETTYNLIKKCNEKNFRIWMHCTNIEFYNDNNSILPNVWKMTSGLISDQLWSDILLNTKIVLCPYETKIQGVSGLIAEAISANCHVLTTNFDFAIEMQKKFPSKVIVNNYLEQWPTIVENILIKNDNYHASYCNWIEFVDDLLLVLVHSSASIMV